MSWREMVVRTGLDWEAWRPTWQENAARPGGEPDQDVDQLQSIALVKRQHPDWTDAAKIEAEARRQFNAGDPSHCTWGVERREEFSPLGSLAGCFLALGAGLGLVGTVSSSR